MTDPSRYDWPGFPNFFCIGAARTASTSLHQYLGQHPDVLMSKEKETDYFSLAGLSETEPPKGASPVRVRKAEEYRKQFAHWSGERAVGEASPSYLYYPQTALRLHQAALDAKIICCLHAPVERAYSHYSLNRKNDIEPFGFADALNRESERAEWGDRYAYVGIGLYDEQLARYFDLFDSSKILVLLFEEFTQNTAATIRRIFCFLGVDEDFRTDTSIVHNRSGLVRGRVLRRLFRLTRLRDRLLHHLPPCFVSRLGRVLMRTFRRSNSTSANA